MGFLKQIFPNHRVDLIVTFQGNSATAEYTPVDSIQEAMEYFNLYIHDNSLYENTDESAIFAELGVNSKEETTALRNTLDSLINNFDDEQAIQYIYLFKTWAPNIQMNQGEKYKYGDTLYTVLQSHTSQVGWEPNITPSLYARVIVFQTPGEYADWEQPDSTNAYMRGDRVRFNEKIYESLVDDNVWSPEAYPAGWTLVDE